MKCPSCGVNYEKDYGLRCSCGYKYVFNPLLHSGMTDGMFLELVQEASNNGKNYYTLPQLYLAWCTRDEQENLPLAQRVLVLVCLLIFSIIFFLFSVFGIGFIVALISLALLDIPLVLARKYGERQLPAKKELARLVQLWGKKHGIPDKLILKPCLDRQGAAKKMLKGCRVGRIILVERATLVDLLILNGFHRQEKALILSVDGYPAFIHDLAGKFLDKHPKLPVFLLHDATKDGMIMHRDVSIPDSHPIVNLGAAPRHLEQVESLKPLMLKRQEFQAPVDCISWPTLSALCTSAIGSRTSFDKKLGL